MTNAKCVHDKSGVFSDISTLRCIFSASQIYIKLAKDVDLAQNICFFPCVAVKRSLMRMKDLAPTQATLNRCFAGLRIFQDSILDCEKVTTNHQEKSASTSIPKQIDFSGHKRHLSHKEPALGQRKTRKFVSGKWPHGSEFPKRYLNILDIQLLHG